MFNLLTNNIALILFAVIKPLIFVVLFESLMYYRLNEEKNEILSISKTSGKFAQNIIES
jgi:hypothetical protein